MNMKLELHINYSPSIINLSEINSSIRNNKHYRGIYQNGVEMVIICSLKVILRYNSWEFRLENFWEWIKENIELITIINWQLKALPIPNHRHCNGSQQDSGEMTLFLHCSTFLLELFWVFRPESIMNMKYRPYTSENNIIGIRIFQK